MHRSSEELIIRSQNAFNAKQTMEGVLHEAYSLALPGGNLTEYSSPSSASPSHATGIDSSLAHQHGIVFDSTLAESLARTNRRIMTEMFPSGSDWADLHLAEDLIDGQLVPPDKALQELLETIQKVVFRAIKHSNFSIEASSALNDFLIAGTGYLRVHYKETGEFPLDFESIWQGDIAFDLGPTRNVEGVYRILSLSEYEIKHLWPEATNIYSEPLGDAASKADPPKYEIYECTYFDRDKTQDPWHYVVIQLDSTEGEPRIIYQSYMALNPWIVFHASKISGRLVTRSPVLDARPSASTLNNIAMFSLDYAAIQSSGIYLIEDGAVTSAPDNIIEPGALIFVNPRPGETGPPIQPLPISGSPELAHMKREEHVQSVKKAMMDESLPEPRTQPFTAQEIISRKQELRTNIGELYTRLAKELGNQVISHAIYTLKLAGKIDFSEITSKEVLDLNGGDVEVIYKNPLMRQQKLVDATSVIESISAVQSVLGREAILSTINVPATARYIMENMEVPEQLLRSDSEATATWSSLIGQFEQGQGALVDGTTPIPEEAL